MDQNLAPVPLWKRFLAFLVDEGLALLTGFLLFFYVTSTFLYAHVGGKAAQDALLSYCADSGLVKMSQKEDGSYENSLNPFLFAVNDEEKNAGKGYTDAPGGVPAYEAYFEKVYSYYTVFLPRAIGTNPDARIEPLKDANGKAFTSLEDYQGYLNVTVLGLPSKEEAAQGARTSEKNAFYALPYAEDGKSVAPLGKPVLREEIQAKVDAKDADALKDLRDYFYNPSAKDATQAGVYYSAVLDLMGSASSSVQTYYQKTNKAMNGAMVIAQVVAFMPPQFLFLTLLPLVLPKRKSLGKLLFHLVAIDKDTRTVLPYWKGALRALYMGVMFALPFAPYQIITMGFFVLFAVDALMLAFAKSGLSLHDRIFGSFVIDEKVTPYFHSEREREEALEKNPSLFYKENPDGVKDEALLRAYLNEEREFDLSELASFEAEVGEIPSFEELEKRKEAEVLALIEDSSEGVNLSKEEK